MTASASTMARQCRLEQAAPGTDSLVRVQIDGYDLALVNAGGSLWAVDNYCTHMRSRLSDGYVEGEHLVCPAHFGRFELRSGAAVGRPCKTAIRTYPVEQREDGVYIELPAAGA